MDNLPNTKPWYQSRTVLGAVVVIASQIAALIGIQVDAAAATEAVLDGVGLIGGLVALWGRFRATAVIK